MKEYNTKQKEMLISFLSKYSDREFTADEIISALPGMSLSTLYRLIGKLEEEGMLKCGRKLRCKTYSLINDECANHLHLKCEKCGHYFHLSKEASNSIIEIIKSESGFDCSLLDIVAKGVCKECKNS